MEVQMMERELLSRADVLMAAGPGRVVVRRVSHIDDVRVLRAAQEALSEDEKRYLQRLRLTLMERLDGIVAAVQPESFRKKGFVAALKAFFVPGRGIGGAASKKARTQGEFEQMVRVAGPARLPAPEHLIDAAAYWALSYLVADRVGLDLSPLRAPWLEASVERATSLAET